MSVTKKVTVAAAVAAAVIAVAVIAEDMKNGTAMMVEPSGKMSNMAMPDKAMMDDMMKHAEEVKDGMVIMVWGQKLYVVKNEKMPDGKMTFDYWGLHGVK
ncbi:MAG TPA: hypothetical protein VKP60_04755 [Magnetospirillaceae bacterium]|nr:hypothetical protein [Magnetospirillaceae bacterium]